MSVLIPHSLRRRLGKMVGGLGAEELVVELLLLEKKKKLLNYSSWSRALRRTVR